MQWLKSTETVVNTELLSLMGIHHSKRNRQHTNKQANVKHQMVMWVWKNSEITDAGRSGERGEKRVALLPRVVRKGLPENETLEHMETDPARYMSRSQGCEVSTPSILEKQQCKWSRVHEGQQ